MKIILYRLKILALLLLVLGAALRSSWLVIEGLDSTLITRSLFFALLVWSLILLVELVKYGGTPILSMLRHVFRRSIWFRLPIGDLSSLIRHVFGHLLFGFMGLWIIHWASGIESLKHVGIIAGSLLAFIHLSSLIILVFWPSLMEVVICEDQIAYFEHDLEIIPFTQLKKVIQTDSSISLITEDDEHDFAFAQHHETEYKAFTSALDTMTSIWSIQTEKR